MITVTTNVHFTTTKAGRKRLHPNAAPAVNPMAAGRIPRISKLMALAIRYDKLLRDGVVADLSELARLARVSQPRMTQIMNLNHLAPDIQEEILHLPTATTGRDWLHERLLRALNAETKWKEQRAMWKRLVTHRDGTPDASQR